MKPTHSRRRKATRFAIGRLAVVLGAALFAGYASVRVAADNGLFNTGDKKPDDASAGSSAATPAARSPVPSAAAIAKATGLMRDLYAADLRKHAPADREALAQKMIAQASGDQGEAADHYVLLKEALDLATTAPTAMAAATLLGNSFTVDAPALRAEIIIKFCPRAAGDEAQTLASAGPDVVKALIGEDQFTLAARTAAAVAGMASRADLDTASALRAWSIETQSVSGQSEPALAALHKLKTAPADPAANDIAGRFLCFVAGNWAQGLPLLAKSPDRAIADLARQDLLASAEATPAAQVLDAANGWYEEAVHQAGIIRRRMRERAAADYQRAAPTLDGLAKTMVEKRLLEIENSLQTQSLHRTVNLLALLDPRNLPAKWQFRDRVLVSPPDTSKLVIPYHPPAEYDLSVEFVRVKGEKDMLVGLSHGNASFAVGVDSGDHYLQFGKIDDKWIDSPARGKVIIENGRPYTLLVKVRNSGLEAFLNGTPVCDYKTDYSDMTPVDGVKAPDGKSVTLGDYQSTIAFHSVTVTEISGRGHVAANGGAAAAITPNADGVFQLDASAATLHGKQFSYNDGRRAVGHWTDRSEYITWTIAVPKSGSYDVILDYSQGDKSARTSVATGVSSDAVVNAQVAPTDSWDAFKPLDMGTIDLSKGTSTLVLKAMVKTGQYALDVRSVKLKPVK